VLQQFTLHGTNEKILFNFSGAPSF